MTRAFGAISSLAIHGGTSTFSYHGGWCFIEDLEILMSTNGHSALKLEGYCLEFKLSSSCIAIRHFLNGT